MRSICGLRYGVVVLAEAVIASAIAGESAI